MKLCAAGLELIKKIRSFSQQSLSRYGRPADHRLRAPPRPSGVLSRRNLRNPGRSNLLWDVTKPRQAVSRHVTVPLTQGQFDALGRLHLQSRFRDVSPSSTLLQNLNAGKYDAAATELLRWDHSGEHEIASLKARREAEFQLWTGAKFNNKQQPNTRYAANGRFLRLESRQRHQEPQEQDSRPERDRKDKRNWSEKHPAERAPIASSGCRGQRDEALGTRSSQR